MRENKNVRFVLIVAVGAFLAGSLALPALAVDVTIVPVVQSLSSGRDAVPGRPAPFVFRGLSTVEAPVINADGDVAFTAFSASEFSSNTGGAFGLYLHQAGQALRVLVDTTLDVGGNPVYPVPGQPAGTFFLNSVLGPPLINDAGDVVFRARWHDPAAVFTGEGFYAINTAAGSPLVKIVDNTDVVPGHPAGQFFNFRFVAPNPSRMAISLNDYGEVVYWAQFCLEATCTSANMKNGLFGSTVAGASGLLLADSTKTICPTGIPFGVTCNPAADEGFWEIRPEKGINNNGDVIFHGKIRRSGSLCCGGVFTIPVTGGPITTVAYRSQPAPPEGLLSFSDKFDEVAHNDAGTALFQGVVGSGTPQRFGTYAGDLTGGPHTRIADTIPGSGVVVPGDPPDGVFTALVFPAMNNAGQMGFRAMSSNSADANNHGIYSADASDGTIRLVVDETTAVPGLPAPANFVSFQNSGGTAINEAGNLAFWGIGFDDVGALFRGIYFYDACADESTRIADSSTALVDLGANFGTSGTRGFDIYTAGGARAGQYDSMNDSNQVAFLTQFSNSDFGIYVASVTVAGGGGSVAITCPADLSLDCGDDTSPTTAGEGVASGCGTISTSFVDSALPQCGGTQTITRTWSADNGAGGVASCNQIITTTDLTSPTVTVPAGATVECGADTSPASTGSATAGDDCDAAPGVAFADVTAPGLCGGEFAITRTWTATDACGNAAGASQFITAVDTVPPTISDLNGSPLLVALGNPVSLTATYADDCAASLDVTWNWGDGTIEVINSATSPTSAIHSYALQDIYTVTVDISDGCGNVATDTIVVVAFDPSDGFTTGGGWFIPDADSFIDGTLVTDTTGKAKFGFMVKYQQGTSNAAGNLQFVYKSGDIDLDSLDMEWLVITSASKVRFKGLAMINGEGQYTFKVTAEDNGNPGSSDTFKIEIWLGVVDTENGPPTPKHVAQGVLGGGNIKIHE